MKKIISIILASAVGLSAVLAEAQSNKKRTNKSSAVPRPVQGSSSQYRQQLAQAMRMAQSGQYQNAANALFTLSRRSELAAERAQIKYILGLMLIELKLPQVAAFQFVDVIRMKHPKYTRQAIEKLSVVADNLGDDTILNYAISRINLSEFPSAQRDMINFRLGEIKLKAGDYAAARSHFNQVSSSSSYSNQALFNKGLAEMELKQLDSAVNSFQTLISMRKSAPVTDTNKVASQLAVARALYQKQDWDAAIQAYSDIPRDTTFWHDALFEQTWAMLRGARFRSALSNFQTLHSAYYEEFYQPESLLLRSIVYLYICKYDEMEKVLGLYEKTYGPVRRKINDMLKSTNDPQIYFREIELAQTIRASEGEVAEGRLPYIVTRRILSEGNIKRSLSYMAKLRTEQERIEANPGFRNSPIGQYSIKILANRQKNSQITIGEMVRAHLLNMRVELRDLYEQAGFIRYEMINGKKEVVRSRLAGKDLDTTIEDKIDRKFYIENGYEYYPFQGEYWLDEIGNYHYMGQQSCQ